MQNTNSPLFVCVRDETDRIIAEYRLLHYPTYQPGDELLLARPQSNGKNRLIATRISKPVVHVAFMESEDKLAQASLNVSVVIEHDSAEEQTESITTNQPDHV